MTLAAVAARAGVAVPSLYKHVDGLPGVRREVTLRCVAELDAVVAAAADAASDADDDPRGRLRAVAHALRAWAHARPGRYQAVQDDWRGHPDAAALQAAAATLLGHLSALVAAVGVPPRRHVDAVRAVRAAVHGFVALELAGGFGLADDVDVSFDFLVDGLVGGLAATADPGVEPG
ncbi:WHG domain-containing protein [Cellulomonas shaoxiangyii]|uniref:WHG domain-containing protein n=1 Tax=Cellulomonas shaoxiangyii TaxID=2566013 RepID=A0A4P7SMC1_9CELL|nr:WHG domain-containing protein [Cellulomonas shaoxiangyii]TGY84780.1 WHG domain-containing protein [Cellulomonas shaoxiangyii]